MKRSLPSALVALAVLAPEVAPAQITVTTARIGCLDIQTAGNLTPVVRRACDGRATCTYRAPTPQQYTAAGVRAATRAFCTQAMEIVYRCPGGDSHTVTVPGDAWKHPPARLECRAAAPPPPTRPEPDRIRVASARIGCLDIQRAGNLTGLVRSACDNRPSCRYRAPTPEQYAAAGVSAATRTFCTQAMEIVYNCGRGDRRTVFVPGDAWNQPAADLACGQTLPPVPPGPGIGAITVTNARIGCLDIQRRGNLTRLVASACNGRATCSYPAPTPQVYGAAGVRAATRAHCTQAMEISYRCGANDDQTVTVPGDAWTKPPARLVCNGGTVATNHQDVTPPTRGRLAEPRCTPPRLAPPSYYLPPRDMLDWSGIPTNEREAIVAHYIYAADLFQIAAGFQPPPLARRADYASTRRTGGPGSALGAHEGRLRAELRAVAAARDPLAALCASAVRFTQNGPARGTTPSDADFGRAFADLAVTGKASFAAFTRERPDEARLSRVGACRRASNAGVRQALDRAYAVANAIRGDHDAPARRALGWIAVSGEDDQPYRPVNVPSTSSPQMSLSVRVPGSSITVGTRYTISHRRPPNLGRSRTPLVDGGTRRVAADLNPAIADDARVFLYIHGMDSRTEEADHLAEALHRLPGDTNWTVVAFDLPTSGYADNIDHTRISPITEVACHNTPLLDFIEAYIVAFVDALDARVGRRLKPRIVAVGGGSLGGNMSMRLGRRNDLAWVRNVVPWSPAAIWPSMIAQRNAVAAGCDTGWDMLKDRGVDMPLNWGGKDPFFAATNEISSQRRALFYGGFDWAPIGGLGGPPQAQCWLSDKFACKQQSLRAARLDRLETYDRFFRTWHWRLAAEQLAFSQQQFADGTTTPLYRNNRKRMLLMCGHDDTCGDLCKYTREVAPLMVNTPGYARFLKRTGHAVDGEFPNFVAREIAAFLGL